MQYMLTGTTVPPYSVRERFAPFRVVMDIAGAEFAAQPKAIPQNSFVKMSVEELAGDAAPGKRFIFTLAESHDYDVSQDGNTVVIAFTPVKKAGSANAAMTGSAAVKEKTAAPAPVATSIYDFQVAAMPNRTTVAVRASKQIEDYTVDKIIEPGEIPRMFIDIAGVNISGLPKERVVNSELISKIRVTPKGDGVIHDGNAAVASAPKPVSHPIKKAVSSAAAVKKPKPAAADAKAKKEDDMLDELILSSEKIAAKDPETLLAQTPTSKLTEVEEAFSLSGYQNQRITVDFYKIDIHNVFRLFREITDLNIIVDENVSGSLTLALNDVPWDFALDIVLNLMNLKKKEKFNTIVIYPADKEFIWPTRAEENLSFEPDMEIMAEQDALVVEKTENQPEEVLKARELLQQAKMLEKQGNLEDAIVLYDKALTLWPQNRKISNRLATLYLVDLGVNAKALFYADHSLKYHADDRSAALYAAIASANMKRLSQANEYFIRSISDTPPKKEALMSYAAFCENNSMNEAALKLLVKYEKFYGEDVNTMIAKARIFDKTGQKEQAKTEYQSVLNSGYQLPPDLRRYIQQRIAGGIR
ncbi:MAG: hypothetical protein CR992_00715 [Desulfobacterales bacterium]|nr:MAG: hypothetical protein CR992_00715 [Desulfobacterales bacterium]